PVHVRDTACVHRNPVESPDCRDRRSRGVRRGADARKRGGTGRGGETMKRLSVLMAVCFVDMLGLMLVAPLMPFYATRMHAPEWMVGWLISAFAVAQLISSPVWGKFSDRYGRRPAMLIGLSASAVAYVVF